ncbi:MAG: lycopene cyclase domain-containing protein [Candidatus Nanopelagicales bacterium]
MKLAYLGVLVFILLASGWLEVVLRTRVYTRWRRLALTLIVPVAVFVVWDIYAIGADHWGFSDQYTTGILLGVLPLEELLFFIVVPIAAILSVEAVRSVKGWPLGDEVLTDLPPDAHPDLHTGPLR